MVRDCKGEARFRRRFASLAQSCEGMKRALVHIVAVNPQQRFAIFAAHDLVRRPHLVEQGSRLVYGSLMPAPGQAPRREPGAPLPVATCAACARLPSGTEPGPRHRPPSTARA